ncbi:selenoprotein H [Tripterygium wilfordii]|uniref:Selenoprotein H n=1 Tax=Tripterygium wilfordii TaxID=458696 RepID=A0A7J7DP02_TRIWF|nr:selenoprotein H-like isoform X2 [Tripterygium wilfordii]KAF5748075.1 selenoprotein H [Tripterygium wilfordii]
MAPRKRKTGGEKKSAETGTTVGRVTRSGTAGRLTSLAKLDELPRQDVRKTKKAKTREKENAKPEDSENENKEEPVQNEKTEEERGTEYTDDAIAKRTIIIEHCKQCTSFKKRADMVKAGLEERVPGINVIVNSEKPRKGCFEVREEGGETFISLLDMKRPFKPMKDLDMAQVISDIIDKME